MDSATVIARGCSIVPAELVRIERLHLRVRGLGADDGRRLGQRVARLVTDASPAVRPGRLGALHVTVTVPAGTDQPRLADLVARAVLEALP